MQPHLDPGPNAIPTHITLTRVATRAAIVKKGEQMNRLVTGWFRPRTRRKMSFVVTLVCLEEDCGYIWESSRLGGSCPKCGSNAVIPAGNWGFGRKSRVRLEMGTVKTNE